MRDLLIRAGWIATFAMMAPMAAGIIVADHNSITQHMSELQLLDGWVSCSVRIGAMVAGLAITLFSVGCLLLSGRLAWSWTALVGLAFGVGMISNGVFIIGSPLHGLYGLPIFSILVPAFFVAEFPKTRVLGGFVGLSLAASSLGLFYMWILLVGLDPDAYRGLTQRIATLISFGWFPLAAFAVSRSDKTAAMQHAPT